jgi:hypothetical protein
VGVKSFDPKKVTAIACGLLIDEGFGEDTFVKVTFKSELWETKVGSDGQVCRVRINDNTAEVEFTLMQTSIVNVRLSALLALDLLGSNGAGVGPFLLKDEQGSTIIESSACWISKVPDVEMGKSAKERVWKFMLSDAITGSIFGGN